jgi:hypothetical protein
VASIARKHDARAFSVAPCTSAEEASAPLLPRTGRAFLFSERIGWCTQGSEIEICIDLVNEEKEATDPATLVIEAAPLGAFVPWSPLAKVPVGRIESGTHLRIVRRVARTALPAIDFHRIAMDGGFGPTFPPAGLDLLTSAEWAGNLNVWFDSAPERAVEVHRALDLKVAAGRSAAILVCVPACNNGFSVDVECMGAGWTAELVRAPTQRVAIIVVGTPIADRRAIVNLWVKRLSDERHVLVELALQSIDDRTEQLGCVRV